MVTDKNLQNKNFPILVMYIVVVHSRCRVLVLFSYVLELEIVCMRLFEISLLFEAVFGAIFFKWAAGSN